VNGIVRQTLPALRFRARALAAALVAALSLVPSIARAHDRLDRGQTPARQHSRFRWTNSCESVPQKVTVVTQVAPVDTPARPILIAPRPAGRPAPLPAPAAPVSLLGNAPDSLRAPPASLA